MGEKDDGGPAFPVERMMTAEQYGKTGISTRDYFAAKAMHAAIAHAGAFGVSYEQISSIAYDFADAMLKERAK